MRWYNFVFFRNYIIFDMFGGVGLDSASSGLVLLNICCLWMFSALQVESKCLTDTMSLQNGQVLVWFGSVKSESCYFYLV